MYPPTLTIAQLAESQGVCTKTARKWCLAKEHPLPSYKLGNIRRIRKDALITWIKQREEGAAP
ncbi:helix-turn-helix domain-containing protein [Paenibacillus wenxiniae]|uniref:Helix-turn-helix domain-containing protein n=2 Tax=Paenibacillus wenxiniae TaxID=1636843 RepID=A0ABW4RCH8_9BACL